MIKFFRKIRQNLLAESKFSQYLIYAIGETFLVVIGILIALSINNWNQERIYEKKIQSKLKLVHQELVEDIEALENEIRARSDRAQLMLKVLEIIEQESVLSKQHKKLLDSALLVYRRMEPLYNNTRTYELFLSLESKTVNDEFYSDLNDYIDTFIEMNARVERFAKTIMEVEYDILMFSSVKRNLSGEFEYSFKEIKQEKNLRETLRRSYQWFEAISNQYPVALRKAKKVEGFIAANYDLVVE